MHVECEKSKTLTVQKYIFSHDLSGVAVDDHVPHYTNLRNLQGISAAHSFLGYFSIEALMIWQSRSPFPCIALSMRHVQKHILEPLGSWRSTMKMRPEFLEGRRGASGRSMSGRRACNICSS